ncbi:class I SAM-dependent RNA methyltransferase [Cereibacter sphaeroides]|uniref:class I SAM-dependent RNA methyltransferase n=1 Tax=Cereibacter sphaeroides TaxID=1063 RepID=UPI001F440594|nr:class I SAM-dependent RNA methyltransferase [Cereibacter sphaeroides]MCE6952257.1 class I SAM-dependent RNA methyltransferase [Cereibacter sphaeroides]
MIVTIERLGHLGDALGGGIFVSGALPGEVVEGEVAGGRMVAPKILTPSPDRVRPPCPHARTCGGCLLQHASDSFVADWKQEVVRSALAGQGLEAPFRSIAVSPPASRRRATLSGRRTKGGALVGFHARHSDLIVGVPDCRLLHPDLMAAIPALEALVVTGGSRSAELALTVTRSLGGPDVSVSGGKPLDAALRGALAQVAERHGLSRLTWQGETVALRVPPAQAFGPARVVPPPGAFLQATAEGEAALLAAVVDAIGEARMVTDLFAGVGTFALPLAQRAEVHAVEGDAAMTAALDRGWRQAAGLKRVTVETRDLFRRPLEPDELRKCDAVVIDPPRAGAEAQTAALARARVPVIAFVSCNPVTFARDSAMLVRAGYRLDWVQVVDQFRWSAHVELAARLSLPA